MKVAICISGQARGFDNCWDYFLKNIITPNNCDIFISFANDDTLENLWKLDNFKFTDLEFIEDPSLEYLYSIARGDVDYIRHQGVMGKECTNLAVLRQYYSMNRANNLKIDYEKRNGFVYDWVIRSRGDLIIETKLDLSSFDNRFIYVPAHSSGGGINDHFAFSSSKNMDIYSDRIRSINELDDKRFPFFNPHNELEYILNTNDIGIKKFSIRIGRDRKWRGSDNKKILKYYGKYGEEVYKKQYGV